MLSLFEVIIRAFFSALYFPTVLTPLYFLKCNSIGDSNSCFPTAVALKGGVGGMQQFLEASRAFLPMKLIALPLSHISQSHSPLEIRCLCAL